MRKFHFLESAFFLLVLVLLFTGCGKKPYFSEVREFPNQKWDDRYAASFEFEIKDTTVAYDINFFLRVGTDYAYNNAWVYLHTVLPNGKKFKEAHQFYVSNDMGEWLGKKSGSKVECKMGFQKKKFPVVGKYKFIVEQATNHKVLQDVESIGLIITPSAIDNK